MSAPYCFTVRGNSVEPQIRRRPERLIEAGIVDCDFMDAAAARPADDSGAGNLLP